MQYRRVKNDDLDELLRLFYETVTLVCSVDYNEDQIRVWTSSVNKTQKWLDRINNQYFIIAEMDGKIVGFGSLENSNYIDLLYVHKDYLRKGVASFLLSELEKESDLQQKQSIISDVSITARPFFEKHGYKVLKEQKHMIEGVEVVNYKMIKEKA